MRNRNRLALHSTAVAGIAALAALALAPASAGPPASAAHAVAAPANAPAASPRTADPAGTLTVMGRNLYLGADIAVALELLPDMPAAAQFMWDQVAATDFDTRVALLAAEAAAARPDIIGLQEATTWSCRPSPLSSPEPVFDFTTQFLEATEAAGVPYVVAEKDGEQALNPGYSIPSIPLLTTVEDPDTFQPLFGTDSAYCGFVIGDALLVREDLASTVQAAGTVEYEDRYAIVPVVFAIDRGYAWADLDVAGTTVRAVTTHLESLWSEGAVAPSATQAAQLVADLAATTAPTIVIGDFNSDPRDPRGPEDPNPAGQPEAWADCPAQPADPTAQTADPDCSAYWTMVAAGFADAGPDPLDPANWTWGSAGDLAGPDPERLAVSLPEGNAAGFTDRLDYIFTRNGASATSALVIGNEWPDGDHMWDCDDPTQVATTEASSAVLAEAGAGQAISGRGVCLPTDHAGLVVQVDVTANPSATAPPLDDRSSLLRIDLLGWLLIVLGVLLLLVILMVWGIYRLATRGRRRRRRAAAAASSGAG